MSDKVPAKKSSSLTSTDGRLYECKSCNEEFPTFRALGGHRANHNKKPRTQRVALGGHLYSCSTCGKEFRIRHSLVTHLRRSHRSAANNKSSNTSNGSEGGNQDEPERINGEESIQTKQHFDVDLNLTPFKNFVENGVFIS